MGKGKKDKMGKDKKDVTPLLMHRSYVFLTLTLRYNHGSTELDYLSFNLFFAYTL